MVPPMNGAQSLVKTLADCGIDLCLGNPGTSEMHFVAALDGEPRMRGVLGLFEGVVTGAADGYARMTGKPACTLLHLGPGFANGIANLHNARRGGSAVVNIVGDHATSHVRYTDAPLSSDIMGICRPVSHWLHSSATAEAVAADGARAVQAARQAPGQIATLLLPADTAWDEGGVPAAPLPITGPALVADSAIAKAAQALLNGRKTALLMRGASCHRAGMDAAGRIAAKTGARVLHDFYSPRVTRGAGLPHIERIPYFAEKIVESLAGLEQLILVGAPPPVTFFAYPGKPSWVTPEGCELITLARPEDDAVMALQALAEAVGAPKDGIRIARVMPDRPSGALNSFTMGQVIARLMPEGTIYCDEAITCSVGLDQSMATGPAHDVLHLTGGAIGGGMPMATGAALACPDRKLLSVSGDGSAMYSLQSLWTQMRENLDVTTVICANKSYAVLNIELARVGAMAGGAKAGAMLDLHNPELDWVALARGMGVEASRADSCESFAAQFESAMKTKGPRLIEAVI